VAYWGGAVGAPLRAAGDGVGVLAIGRPCSERTSRGAAIPRGNKFAVLCG
jgi:hypothetical protein